VFNTNKAPKVNDVNIISEFVLFIFCIPSDENMIY
jgi:hypothetical protein